MSEMTVFGPGVAASCGIEISPPRRTWRRAGVLLIATLSECRGCRYAKDGS